MRLRTIWIATIIGILGCASDAPSKLPGDVAEFIERRETCDHFRGEEAYSPERRAQIGAATEKYCRGSDRELAALRSKYRSDGVVMNRLKEYEADIEAR